MSRIGVRIEVAAPVGAAEALWYDPHRWPGFVDGLARLVELQGDWPHPGARVVWESTPAGRGRVVEEVLDYEPGAGQTVAVEDPRLSGTQRVSFVPADGDGTEVRLELEYGLRDRNPFMGLVDLLFIRRAIRDSLRRTLDRFGHELAADREPLR
jgi:uncharacterized membrane protein